MNEDGSAPLDSIARRLGWTAQQARWVEQLCAAERGTSGHCLGFPTAGDLRTPNESDRSAFHALCVDGVVLALAAADTPDEERRYRLHPAFRWAVRDGSPEGATLLAGVRRVHEPRPAPCVDLQRGLDLVAAPTPVVLEIRAAESGLAERVATSLADAFARTCGQTAWLIDPVTAGPDLATTMLALVGAGGVLVLKGGIDADGLVPSCGRRCAPLIVAGPASTDDPALVVVRWDLGPTSAESRDRALDTLLANRANTVSDADRSSLAARYRLGPLALERAAAAAWSAAVTRRPRAPSMSAADLQSGMRAQLDIDLGAFARRIEPRGGLDALILPAICHARMRELASFVLRRATVYERWGFQGALGRGVGAKALFHGRPGTGKTMAAECLAGELGLPLFQIDLSAVLSKWIGETEKHLARIFAQAEQAQCVLLFDEADALFGGRTAVQSANDRFANLETNYLLQRIESFDGVVLLSTNLRQNIDDAFTRRFHFVLEFPLPERDARLALWRRAFPTQAPLEADVALEGLAAQFRLTGGNIQNCAVRAAFLAAEEGGSIALVHVLRAIGQELQNVEREPTERDFGAYWPAVRAWFGPTEARHGKEIPR